MNIHICVATPLKTVRIGWISFQPDGSISFGTSNKTFVVKKHKIRINVWNAYNRTEIRYDLTQKPSEIEAIANPHFTYHPEVLFHLKDNNSAKEAIFQGIADVGIAVEQTGFVPWARLISPVLHSIPPRKAPRAGNKISNEDFVISVHDSDVSARASLDFVDDNFAIQKQNQRIVKWKKVNLLITLDILESQKPRLYWFHQY